MARQFPKVDVTYGAPMGRSNWLTAPGDTYTAAVPGKLRLFKVRLDSGGYDDGGAYWGCSRLPLYCATDDENWRYFLRATCREAAKQELRKEFPKFPLAFYR